MRTSLIDTGTETIDLKGTPIGLPFLDVAQVYNHLSIKKIWGLSDKEIDLLHTSFVDAYKSETHCFPNSEQMALFQIVDMLKFFVWYAQVHDKLDDKSRKVIGNCYKHRLESCLLILNNFTEITSASQL